MNPWIFLYLCLFSAGLVAQEPDTAFENTYTVIINNTCSRNIRVAAYYEHPEMGWVTQGWWNVAGRSELATGIVSSHFQFYMHGTDDGRRQWPPENSRKQYNSYPVLQDSDFLFDADGPHADSELVKFSLKEISPQNLGLKARFDC